MHDLIYSNLHIENIYNQKNPAGSIILGWAQLLVQFIKKGKSYLGVREFCSHR